MEPYYPTIDEPATPEFVLEMLRDEQRQLSQVHAEVDPDATLSFSMSVAEWRGACHLLPWRKLGRAYNRFWNITCSDAEWRAVLEPRYAKRLSNVCRLIAQHTTMPRVRPSRLMGGECLSAGVFRTIRSLLHDSGADVRGLRPSTSLKAFTRKYPEVFLGPIARLAPGALPSVQIQEPCERVMRWMTAIALAMLVLGGCLSSRRLLATGGIALTVLIAASWIIDRWIPPVSVSFGELKTFSDLAEVIACRCRR
jgi:hypothetical protein